MSLQATILGCGSSAGVPRVGGDWGNCDPCNPKNRRRRCSLLIEKETANGQTSVLVDTSPDLREQLLFAEVKWLDAVLYTHDHADHTHGIDDLRTLAMNERKRVDVYMDQRTYSVLTERFSYCFKTPEGSLYPPILNAHMLEPGSLLTVDGPGGEVAVTPFLQHHGNIDSLGFRFGNLAYSSDLHDLPQTSLKYLEDLDIWIVDCLRRKPHKTHFNLEDALRWIEAVKPKKAILTNMHVDLDYTQLVEELPKGVIPAYDGMTINM